MTKKDEQRGRLSTTAARKWIAQNAFIPNQSDCWPTREVVRAMTEFAESCQLSEAEIEEVARIATTYFLEGESQMRITHHTLELAKLLRGKLGGAGL